MKTKFGQDLDCLVYDMCQFKFKFMGGEKQKEEGRGGGGGEEEDTSLHS